MGGAADWGRLPPEVQRVRPSDYDCAPSGGEECERDYSCRSEDGPVGHHQDDSNKGYDRNAKITCRVPFLVVSLIPVIY